MTVTTELALVDRAYDYVVQRQLVTSVGLAPTVSDDLTSFDAEMLLTYSGTLDDISRWVIADLLVWGEQVAEREIGNRNSREYWRKRDGVWDAMLRVCKTDMSKHTAYNMAACAKAWPWGRRRHTETISFEHHRVLVSRNGEDQEYWLDLAEAGGWSVKRLRSQLFGDNDPLAPVAVMSKPIELWPDDRIQREMLDHLRGYWDVPFDAIEELLNKMRGEYEDALRKERYRQYPR